MSNVNGIISDEENGYENQACAARRLFTEDNLLTPEALPPLHNNNSYMSRWNLDSTLPENQQGYKDHPLIVPDDEHHYYFKKNPDVEKDLRNEMLLLEREKDLLRREREIFEKEKQHHSSGMYNKPIVKSQPFLHPTDVVALIPEFDPGLNEQMNAKQWLDKIEYLKNLYHWDDLQSVHYASTRLKGAAKVWFAGQRDLNLTFEKFKFLLDNNFSSFFDESDLHFRLSKRKKRHEETYEAYFFSMRQLAGQGSISESAFMKYIISGITDQNVARSLALTKFENSNDLLRQLRWFEEIVRRQISKPLRDNQQNQQVKSIIQNNSIQEEIKPVKRTNSVRCYNCNQHGHVSSNCTKESNRPKCTRCQRIGHTIENCFRKEEHVGFINGAESFKIKLSCDKLERDVVGLLDTGSPINLIKCSLIPSKLELIVPENISYSGINYSKLSVLGIVNLDCIINKMFVKIRFQVVPDRTMTYDCVLGREFMQDPGINLVINIKDLETTITIQDRTEKEQTESKTINLFNEVLSIDYEKETEDNLELDIGPYFDNYNDNIEIKNKFKDMFNNFKTKEIKDKPAIEHELKISLSTDKPIYNAPKRLSIKEKEEVREIVNDLLDRNIIRPSNSTYSSRIVLVKKKNGTLRLCVDYRDLNKITIKDRFPIPLIEDCLDKLRDKKVFSLIDLKNGFHHVPVDPESIKYTSFVTPDGQFEYIKTPFGLCNAPSVFQRFIVTIFKSLIESEDVLIYIDDIMIATETVEKHFQILEKVFELLYDNCLEIQPKKCSFFKRKINYLGYEINQLGIKPSSHHIDAVNDFGLPQNIHELNRFIGLTSFFRKFIHNFSTIAKPLYDLVRKDADFIFSEKEKESFDELKRRLISSPILSLYNPKLETELHTDASSVGFGGILLQRQTDGNFHPVFYFSKRTTDAEAKYHSFELEALAIIYALKRFHIYLHGIKFTIVTDCNSLKQTLEKKDVNARIMRWSLFLENYDYVIVHRNGTRMRHVDALSRTYSVFTLQECSLAQTLAAAQLKDRDLEQIRKEIEIVTDKNQLINKAQFDKRRKESEKYNNGDFVMIRNNVTETGVNHKLIPKYKGPYIVKETLPNDRYVITDIPGQRLSNKSFNGVFAPFNMKHFIEC